MRLWKMLINAGNKVSALNTANITLIAEAILYIDISLN